MPDLAAREHPTGRLMAHLHLMRLPNAVTAAADVLAGGALAGAAPKILLFPALSAILLYAGGCVLNDLRDREIDRTKHPHRPLPRGIVLPREALFLAFLLFGAALAAASLGGVRSATGAVLLLALVLLYDLGVKRDPLAGPAVLGGCRAAAVLLGLAATSPPDTAPLLFVGAHFFYVFMLSRLAQWETLPFPASPPAAPLKGSALLALSFLGAGIALMPGFSLLHALPFIALWGGVAGASLGRGLRPRAPRDIPRGVGGLILGIPLLAAVAAAGTGGVAWGLVAACCALPPWLGRKKFDIT